MTSNELDAIVEEVSDRVERGIDAVRAYLASPEGQQLRRRLAQGLVVAAPFVFRSKFVTRTPIGRLLAVAGGAALVVKLAEAIRDWEPVPAFDANPPLDQ